MKYETKEAFEKANMFGQGAPSTAYAQYFIGDSLLNPLTNPQCGLFAANVTFAPKFAELNDDVLFGQVWSREDKLSLRDRSLVTVVARFPHGQGNLERGGSIAPLPRPRSHQYQNPCR